MDALSDLDEALDAEPRHDAALPFDTRSRRDATDTPADASKPINDPRFCSAVRLLGIIYRISLYNRKVPIEEISLWPIHTLRLASTWQRCFKRHACRSPTMEEWQQVETKTITLMRRLSPDQIKKVQLKHISGVLLEKVALWLLVGSIITLLAALLIGKEHPIMFGIEYQIMFLACFTGWLAATGALGSTAFIYVNALSIQVDPTVDITSRTLVILRLNLGALFAVILSLPFGYKSFQTFSEILFDTQKSMGVNDSVLLLLPFIMGFSTPLVLAILGRFIQGAGTLFGLPHATLSQDPKPGDNGDVQLARLTSNPARSDPSGLSAVGFSAAATRAAGSR